MKAIFAKRIVPVVVLDNVADAAPLCEALLAADLNVIEITFRTQAAPEVVRTIATRFPQMTLGAGTLLTAAQVQQAKDAGAQFGVTPGLNPSVVRAANALRWPISPGVMTPSNVELALELGCQLLKFFPADVAGGVKMLKALAGPYAHTGGKFIPLGGINAGNMAEYLALPMVAAIGGSWIADKKLIAAKDWAAVTRNAREALAIARSVG